MKSFREARCVGACVIAIVFSLSARDSKRLLDVGGYSHGTSTCLQGIDGPGYRVRLTRKKQGEGVVEYPYLEMDVRELPIPVRKRIAIGSDNWGFKCANAKESCKQALSGEIVFDHFEHISAKHIQTDGHYTLRFSTSSPERATFKVDGFAPCG